MSKYRPTGAFGVLMTPFGEDKKINYEVFEREVEFLSCSDIDGLFPSATTDIITIKNMPFYTEPMPSLMRWNMHSNEMVYLIVSLAEPDSLSVQKLKICYLIFASSIIAMMTFVCIE